jgi:hypothetical protein
VETDIAAGFASRPRAGHLLGAQHQDLFQHLVSEFRDHALDHMAGILDENCYSTAVARSRGILQHR